MDWKNRSRILMMPTIKKVILQPIKRPIILPSGKPAIIATLVPVTIMLIANSRFSSLTSLTAITLAIDQNMAWAQATTSLPTINIRKFIEIELMTCPRPNKKSVVSKIFL